MSDVRLLPVAGLEVDPYNCRGVPGDVDDLAASVAAQGVLQPLLVRPTDGGGWLVVAGQRRLAAARQAGLQQVPCTVADLDDAAAAVASAAENLSRADLDPITEAELYRHLRQRTGLSQKSLAAELGVAESTMVQRVKLLELPADLREQVRDGTMSVGAAYRMVKKAGAARAEPRRRPHAITEDDVDFLDVVALADDLVRQVRRHIADHIEGDTVTDFVARAVRRELARPSCHEDGCHDDALGGGRRCRRHFSAKATPPPPSGCGTAAGYQRHRRAGEPACPACTEANAAYKQAPSELTRPPGEPR